MELCGTTSPGLRGPGSNSKEEALHIFRISRSSSDGVLRHTEKTPFKNVLPPNARGTIRYLSLTR